MSRHRFLPSLLAVALVAQSVIAGWGHSHVHLADGSHVHLGSASHANHSHANHRHANHRHSHHHHATIDRFHDSDERSSLPNLPADQDDCAVCRHLALSAILMLDFDAVATGDIAAPVQAGESDLLSSIAIGLRRPRSPPELS